MGSTNVFCEGVDYLRALGLSDVPTCVLLVGSTKGRSGSGIYQGVLGGGSMKERVRKGGVAGERVDVGGRRIMIKKASTLKCVLIVF